MLRTPALLCWSHWPLEAFPIFSHAQGPPKAVLPEEDYSAHIDAIIERDFFPDIPKLRSIRQAQVAGARNWRRAALHCF
jgi:hypothetical protein